MPRSAEAPGFVALAGGDARVEVVPQQGGRVRSLHAAGREWLLDELGWDECAPAATGEEASAQAVGAQVTTGPEGPSVVCAWQGTTLPWTMTRRISVHPDGSIEASYEATTSGPKRIPFVWNAAMHFPLSSGTQLTYTDGARMRLEPTQVRKAGTLADGSVGRWPRLTIDGKLRDLSRPWNAPARHPIAGWLDLSGPTTMLVAEGSAQLSIVVDAAEVPCCGLMIDRGGHATAPSGLFSFLRSGTPAIALRPSLRAPDRVVEGLGDALSTTWLTPGEPRRWTMTIRGGG